MQDLEDSSRIRRVQNMIRRIQNMIWQIQYMIWQIQDAIWRSANIPGQIQDKISLS